MSAFGGLAALTRRSAKEANKYRHFLWACFPKIGSWKRWGSSQQPLRTGRHSLWRRRTDVWRERTSPISAQMLPKRDGSGGAISPLRAALSAHAAVFYRPLVALKLNMSWHDPDLYLFLCVLAVFAGLLAIIDDCIQKFCKRKPKQGDGPAYLRKARPLDGLLRGRPLQRRMAHNLRNRSRRSSHSARH